MDFKRLITFTLVLLLIVGCSVDRNDRINSDDGLNTIAISDYVKLKDYFKFENAEFIAYLNSEVAIPVAQKIISTDQRKYYLTQSVINRDAILIAMNNDFSPVGYINSDLSGAPLSIKSITDFYVRNDTVVLYDFQSQKLLYMDQDLKKIAEQRLPYYLSSINLSPDLGVVGYSGKMGQTLNDSTTHHDLLIFDDKYRLKNVVGTFDPERYKGVVLHTFKPLLKSDAGLLYSEYLNDTVYELNAGLNPKYIFKYSDELSLPAYIATLSHPELLTKLKSNELSKYQKAASPIFESIKHLIFSFGDRDVLRLGFYDREKQSTYVFDDYNSGDGATLLKVLYMDRNENYVSVIYPFELMDLIDQKVISESDLGEEFLDRLYSESLDGTPIVIRYKLKS